VRTRVESPVNTIFSISVVTRTWASSMKGTWAETAFRDLRGISDAVAVAVSGVAVNETLAGPAASVGPSRRAT
jgi:hypothetical protein